MKQYLLSLFIIGLFCLDESYQYNKIGGNVDGVADYSQDHPFCDMVKQSRQFGLSNAPWTVNNSIVLIGSDGWPLSDFGVILWIDNLNPMNGTYKMKFISSVLPTVSLVASAGYISNLNFDSVNQIVTADIIAPTTNTQMMLSFKNTNGGIRNLSVIRPQCDQVNPSLFTPQFLANHKQYNTLRFMDWGRTNGNSVSNWTQRTLCSYPTMQVDTGVCWEYQISLVNQLQTDIWINVPYLATDNYITNLANLLNDLESTDAPK